MDLDLMFPHSRQRLSNVSQLTALGVGRAHIREWLAAGVVLRIRRGVYADRPLPARGTYLLSNGLLDLGYLAEVRAVVLGLSDRSVVAGRTAALLWGFDLAVEPTEVEVAVAPGGARKRVGVTLFQLAKRPQKLVRPRALDPIRVLDAVATVLHCALTLPVNEAVVIADSAMRKRTVTRRQLADAVRKEHGKPHYRRLRKVLEWSDEKSGSVLESLFRVLVLEAGLARPSSQVTFKGVGRVDFCWKEFRLIVECDGRVWHDPDDARHTDRRRDNKLVLQSWRVLRYTWADVVHDPDRVIAELRAALEGWMAAA
jgi:very-short-patch-repair endonuclease